VTSIRSEPTHQVHRLRGAVAQAAGGYQVECSCGWHSPTVSDAGEMLVAWRIHGSEPDRRKSR
jgi:hypothetical protein